MLARLLLVLAFLLCWAAPAAAQAPEVDLQELILTGIDFDVTVRGLPEGAGDYAVRVNGGEPVMLSPAGIATREAEGLQVPGAGVVTVEVLSQGAVIQQATSRAVPGWLSILPPVLAILIALVFKRVVPALFMGIWVGAWAVAGGLFIGAWEGLLATFAVYVRNAMVDADRIAIILFSLMIGGMVGIISRNGGMQGVVNKIIGWASTPRKGQLATGGLGIAIFFDDYANTLVVGNTMRSVTDRLRISREKLAYIVDSTAAPVACLALVTTWIGYEVGLINDAVEKINGFDEAAYSIFLNSIPYSFYPLLAIFFVFAVAHSRRDFGPMLDAEVRARTTGKVLGDGAKVDEGASESKETTPKEGMPHRAINAILPVLTLVVGVLLGLYVTGAAEAGAGASLREIIGEADSFISLLWASLAGVLVASLLSIGQRILTIDETIDAWYGGLKAMLFAMIILVLAWSLSDITGALHTADFLVSILGETLPPGIIPSLVFILAAATAFATGTSWGTMGILMPLVVPLAWAVLALNDMTDPEHYHIIYSSVSCVLAGAVWGDHCSPISDTTILSSMASGCDHIEHVRTQLPYALTVGFVALLLGTLPVGFGLPWWVSLVLGLIVLSLGLRFVGKNVPDEVAAVQEQEQVQEAAV